MKKLEIIIRPERLDDLKNILNSNGAHGLMISNIMGYGSQRGHKQVYNGVDFGGNLLPKVKLSLLYPMKLMKQSSIRLLTRLIPVNTEMVRFSYMMYMMP